MIRYIIKHQQKLNACVFYLTITPLLLSLKAKYYPILLYVWQKLVNNAFLFIYHRAFPLGCAKLGEGSFVLFAYKIRIKFSISEEK